MSDDTTFGRWLKEQRGTRDLTQEGLAELLDVSPSAVRKFETGERRPSRQLAEVMAQRFGLQGAELARFNRLARARDEAAPAPAPPAAPPAPPEQPPPAPRPRATNLPVPLTSFVGRQYAVEEVSTLLRRADVRLVTLLGPPGIGKTRLSIEVGNALAAEFRHGVWWVPLALVHDANLVPTTILNQLGVKEENRSPEQTLQSFLRERELLLVLDNFEQVTAAATILADLLAAAPGVKLLVSSRAVLQLYGEHIFPVPFLSLPDASRSPALDQLDQYEALSLFMQRARAVRPGFSPAARDVPLIAEICARLEGLPLAIELAAARMRLLAPRAILTRLESRLDLLSGGAVDLPERQQTLRGAIAWSYDLLDANEQSVFARLGVFVGGCTLDAAQEVVGTPGVAGQTWPLAAPSRALPGRSGRRSRGLDVAEVLESLAIKSLVRSEEGPDGEPRFTMLETIREYALEKLDEAGELAELRRRHAEFCLALAEQAEPELIGPDQQIWLQRLDSENDNIRAALEWSIEAAAELEGGTPPQNGVTQPLTRADSPGEVGLRIAAALWRFWEVHGQVAEGRKWLALALQYRSGAGPALLAKALNGAGNLAFDNDDYGQAIEFHEASLDLNRALGDQSGIAKSLNNLGNVAHRKGDYALSQRYHEESLALRRALGDGRGVAISLINLGEAAAEQNDRERARLYFQQAMEQTREMGESWGTALSLNNLGEMALHDGDYATAESQLGESLALFRQLGDMRGSALALGNLGLLARRRADFRDGEPIYKECLTLFRELGSRHGIAVSLEGLAAVAGGLGDTDRAARLRGAATAVRATIGAPHPPDNRPDHERRSLQTRPRDSSADYQRNWALGRAMNLEQAVDYAMEG